MTLLVAHDQPELIGHFEKRIERILREDFPESALRRSACEGISVPRRWNFIQLLGRKIADENLVRRIADHFVKRPQIGEYVARSLITP